MSCGDAGKGAFALSIGAGRAVAATTTCPAMDGGNKLNAIDLYDAPTATNVIRR